MLVFVSQRGISVAHTNENVQASLARHHRTAVLTVGGMLAITLLLLAGAFADLPLVLPSRFFDPTLAAALWIAIVVFGLGAVALRRTRFSAMRLQDIASLRGTSALLATLQNTTILVALLGGSIAFMGFIIALITDDKYAMLRAAPIAIAVLFYCYPRREAWRSVVEMTQATGAVHDGGADAPPAKGTMA